MIRLARLTRVWFVFVLLLATLGPALPAARAEGGYPPPRHPRSPVRTTPNQPAGGILPAAPPGCANAVVPGSNNTVQTIPDYSAGTGPGIITSTITITTPKTYLWAIAVTTHIKHPYNQDLDIHLISPAGSVIILVDRPQGLNHNYPNVFNGTTWADQAGLINGSDLPVTDYVFMTNTVASSLNPQEALSALRGQNPNGDWKLVVSDNEGGDTGELDSWSISIVALAQVPIFNSNYDDNTSIDDLTPMASTTRFLYPGPSNAVVSAITVTTVITHPLPADLNIYLLSPDGITITLSSGNGGAHPNVFGDPGTIWTDFAALDSPPVPVSEYPFADNTVPPRLAPEQALGELTGINANTSFWTLQVDNTGDADGQLGEVILEVQTATCLPNMVPYVYARPNFPIVGLPLPIVLESSNVGADATGVVMTGTLPSLLTYQGITPFDWSCVAPAPGSAGGNIICHRPSQLGGDYLTVYVTTTAPLLPQFVPLTVTATSAQPDTYPPDNVDATGISVYVRSANHNPWDLDTYSGAIGNGGQEAFSYWGRLRLAVLSGTIQLSNVNLGGFHLAYAPGHRWETTTPASIGTIRVSRSLFAPAGADWLRYVDTFTNTSNSLNRTLIVDWGGNLNSSYTGAVAATSNGDQVLDPTDTWAVTIRQQVPGGPAKRPPLGYAFRSPGDLSYRGPANYYAGTITTTWSVASASLAHQFKFSLPHNSTVKLAYFVYRGLAEGTQGPQDCFYYGGCVTPGTGTQVALAESSAALLAANPYFCDLSPAERAQIVNWPGIVQHCTFLPVLLR